MTEANPVRALEARLAYAFRDPSLLDRAVTHPSYLQDHPEIGESNQRLEFLGDAVLQLILTQRLFEDFPGEREGALTKRRAALTNGAFLAGLAREIGLDACLRLGVGEEASGGRSRSAALEDALEALVGALSIDGGFDEAVRVVLGIYGDLTSRIAGAGETENPKGRLQELVQKDLGNDALRYDVLEIEGADHAREYTVAVFLKDRDLGHGRGSSKKAAEEAAARKALEALDPCPPASS
jgi:ribonuclease-3